MDTIVTIPFLAVDDSLATLDQLTLFESSTEEYLDYTFPPTPVQVPQTMDVQIRHGPPPYFWNAPGQAAPVEGHPYHLFPRCAEHTSMVIGVPLEFRRG